MSGLFGRAAIASLLPVCTYYLSPSGSDSNGGGVDAPWQHLQKAFDTVLPGQVVCLRGGVYEPLGAFDTSSYSQVMSRSGSPNAPITFQNYPGEIPVIHGHTRFTGGYVNLTGLVLSGPLGSHYDEVLVYLSGAHHMILSNLSVHDSDHRAGIFLSGVNNIQILKSRIFNNGRWNLTAIPEGGFSYNKDQGIYWASSSGGGNVIANSVLEHNRAFGIQFYPAGSNVVFMYNTVVNNGNSGLINSGGSNNLIVNNIFSGNGSVVGAPQARFPSGSQVVVDSNIAWSPNPALQGFDNGIAGVVNTITQDPLFSNYSSGDYRVGGGSPAIDGASARWIVSEDIRGITRPVGSAYDLGAYEGDRPVSTPPQMSGDFNHDGRVDILDLRSQLSQIADVRGYSEIVGNFGR